MAIDAEKLRSLTEMVISVDAALASAEAATVQASKTLEAAIAAEAEAKQKVADATKALTDFVTR